MRTILRTLEGTEENLFEQKPVVSTEEKIHIRWMIQFDLESVQQIEKECFEYQWSKEDFINCLRRRNCVGLVAEYKGEIVGFMIYEFMKRRIHLLNFGIVGSARRHHFGSQLVARLIGKLQRSGRTRITFAVRERNLAAQLFFRKLGFCAVSILRNFYEEAREDAYLMQYHIPTSNEVKINGKRRFLREYK